MLAFLIFFRFSFSIFFGLQEMKYQGKNKNENKNDSLMEIKLFCF